MVIKIDPKNSLAYFNLGTSFLELEKYEKALECFNEAIKLDSKKPLYFLNRAMAKDGLGLFKESIKDFEMVIKIDPKNSLAYFNLGHEFLRTGKI